MRLIDADELRQKMCYVCIDTDEETEKGRVKWDSGLWIRYKVFEDTLILAPTVDAEPIRHGHWTDDCRCSECGAEAITEWNETGGAWVMTPFCPNCGAKMDEVGDDES